MAQDGAGNVHLVVVGRTAADQQTLNVLRLEWNGTNWSAPDVVTTVDPATRGDVPQWPVLVGAAIIIAAGLFIFFREQRLALPVQPDLPPER